MQIVKTYSQRWDSGDTISVDCDRLVLESWAWRLHVPIDTLPWWKREDKANAAGAQNYTDKAIRGRGGHVRTSGLSVEDVVKVANILLKL